MSNIKQVARNIKNNSLPILTSVVGVGVGAAIAYKLQLAHVHTVGHWVADLERKGCSVLVVTNSVADVISQSITAKV